MTGENKGPRDPIAPPLLNGGDFRTEFHKGFPIKVPFEPAFSNFHPSLSKTGDNLSHISDVSSLLMFNHGSHIYGPTEQGRGE